MTIGKGRSNPKRASFRRLKLAGTVLAFACSGNEVGAPPPPPAYSLRAISPTSAVAGSPDLTVTLTGSGFRNSRQNASRAIWRANDSTTDLATNFVSNTQLTAVVPAALLRDALAAQMYVATGDPTGDLPLAQTNPVAFTVAPSPPADNTVADVVIYLPPATIGVGETALLHAWANGALVGRIKPSNSIIWRSADTTIARLDSADVGGYPGVDFWALLHGVRRGTVAIRAATGEKSATVTITVGEPASSVTISPTGTTLSAPGCESVQLAIAPRDALGNRLTGRRPVWTSSNPGVAYVDPQTGLAAAVDSGTATITATTGLISANAAISVTGRRPAGRFACDG